VRLFLWRGARKGSKPIAEFDHHSQGHYHDPKLGYPAQLQSPGFRHEVSAEVSEIRDLSRWMEELTIETDQRWKGWMVMIGKMEPVRRNAAR